MELVHYDPSWTIERLALETERVATEGLGRLTLNQLRRKLQIELVKRSSDPEMQLKVVALMLVSATDSRKGPKDNHDIRVTGLCLMWLAKTHMKTWTMEQVYKWVLEGKNEWYD